MDFTLHNHGSICLLQPLSRAGRAWLDEHVISSETLFWAGAVVVEPRYVGALVQGIRDEGLAIHG